MRMGFAEGPAGVDAFGGWGDRLQVPRVSTAAMMPARDEQLAAIFRQMRAVVGLNEGALARLLGTDISVIMDLEAGIADGLPAWPDLVRIIERYASIAGVDPSPIVTRLMQISLPPAPPPSLVAPRMTNPAPPPVFEGGPPPFVERFAPPRAVAPAGAALVTRLAATAGVVTPSRAASGRPPATAASRVPLPPASIPGRQTDIAPRIDAPRIDDAEIAESAKPARRRRRWLSRAGAPLFLLAFSVGVYFAVMQLPRVAYAAVGLFPARLQEPVRNVIDLAIVQTAAVRDGLKWIDVGDPRLRKSNRLTTD